MNNKNPYVFLVMLALLIAACQPRTALRSEVTGRASETPALEITPSRTLFPSTPTRQVILPTETKVPPAESPQPTSTSNSVPLSTRTVVWQPTPTMNQAETAVPTPTFDTGLLSSVYFWSSWGPYGTFDLRGMRLIRLRGLNDDIYPGSPGQYPRGFKIHNLAFANYSPFMAYIRRVSREANTPRELWIADLSPINARRVWVDENKWLGNIGDGDSGGDRDSDILWGPFDRYVLIWSYLPEHPERWWDLPDKPDHMVVYDSVKREAYEWRGDCNRLAKSPFSKRIAVWCPIKGSDLGYAYAVLEPNGVFFTKYDPESVLADALAWRFSPDGERVLFLGQDFRWRFTDQDQQIQDIPVSYTENFRYPSPKALNFQWSRDGRRLLVYGSSDNPDLCPYSALDADMKPNKRGCWFVIDAQTREVIWSITPSVIATVGLSIENSSIDNNAALSPDGQFIILMIADTQAIFHHYLVITSLVTGESSEIVLDESVLGKMVFTFETTRLTIWLPIDRILWTNKASR